MPAQDLLYGSIPQARSALGQGRLSPSDLAAATLERIERLDGRLNAYISVFDGAARSAGRLRNLDRPLAGIPIAIKDLIFTREAPTSCGSRVFGAGIRCGDAPVVGRLRRAGAVLVGKTNLHEFAYGVTNENEHFGPCRNPWDRRRVTGGSSGGSAAAVAAALCFGSLGTDTRGSIRMPSACCGITGLKPTFGLVSTRGVYPLSWSLDHVGPMARSVEDVFLLLEVITGKTFAAGKRTVRGLRLGLCDYFLERIDPGTERVLQRAVAILESGGARASRLPVGGLEAACEASGIIARTESVSIHDENLRSKPGLYGPAVRARLETGYQVTGLEYVKAMAVRREMTREFRRVFAQTDLLIGASLPAPPHRIGASTLKIGAGREAVVAAFVRLNAPQNVGGVPALVLPGGFAGNGLPVGIQLIAGHGREDLLYRAGAFFQRETDWHRKRPPL